MDSFYQWLAKAHDERDSNIIWLFRDPILDSVRSEQRFENILKKIHLPINQSLLNEIR